MCPATHGGSDDDLVHTDGSAAETGVSMKSEVKESYVSVENAAPTAVKMSKSAKKRRRKKGITL